MRLGIGSYTYTWAIGVPGYPSPPNPLDAFRLLDKAVAFGLTTVQIGDNLPLIELTERERHGLAERAFSAGIHVEIGTRGIDPANLRSHLALARLFQSPFVQVAINPDADEPTTDEVIYRLAPLVPEFAEAGVKIAVENSGRFPSKALKEIVEALGTEIVGVCLDTANSFGVLESSESLVSTLGPYTINLHLKDFRIRRAADRMGFVIEGTPAGQGQLDIADLLRKLPNCQSAILELWTPRQDTTRKTVDLEALWAVESLDFLCGLFAEA